MHGKFAPDTRLGFLSGGREMGTLIRAHDWSATSLGRPDDWPQPLKTLVAVMLGSNQPMFIAWGAEQTLLYNDGYAEILALKHPEALGRPFLEVWDEIRSDLLPIVQQGYAGEPVHMDDIKLIMHRRGYPEETHFAFSYTPVRDESGGVAGIFCPCTEITGQVLAERRRQEAEVELRAERDRARRVLDGMAEGFGLLDREFRVIDINAEGLRLEERPREAVLGKTHWEAWPGSEDSELGRLLKRAMAERVPANLEHRCVWADSHEAWLELRVYPTDDGLALFWRDVTERKQAEAALRESEEFTRRILESSTDCIKVLDTDARLRFMSTGGQHIMEVDDFGAIEGCDWRDFWSGPDHEKAQEAVRTALAGGNARFQGQTPTMKGKSRWWDVAVTPIPNPNGSIDKLLSVSRDITDHKRSEEHQRLLINELNHRVKNTLATVQSIASQTLRNAETAAEAKQAIEGRLLSLSRVHDVLTRENWEGAHLRDIVAEAVAPYSNRREDRLHLSGPDVRLPPRVALALAMALQELATNAVKYGALSNDVGEIRIRWMLDHTTQPPRLCPGWQESGGPPVQAPKRRGFGTRLIERSLALDLEGEVRIAFEPSGVICTVDAPLAFESPPLAGRH